MTTPLDPSDVPRREPGAQIVSLPSLSGDQPRLLARHPRGVTLLRGVSAEDLQTILDLADGTRTVARICEELEVDETDAAAIRQLMGRVEGELVRVVRGADADVEAERATGPRVLVIADGEVGARVRALLAQAGISVEATVPPGHESPGYVAAPPEGGVKPRLGSWGPGGGPAL